MAPRASARSSARTPQPVVVQPAGSGADDGAGFRPIIQHRLPEMPGRMSTAYGSAVANNPRSPMRGLSRNLQNAVDRALDHALSPAAEGGDETDLLNEPTELEEDELAHAGQTPARKTRRTPSARGTPSAAGGDDDELLGEGLPPRERSHSAAPPVHKDPRLKGECAPPHGETQADWTLTARSHLVGKHGAHRHAG
jgi:hypothetical protein